MSLKILITLFILPKDLCIVHPLQVSPNPLNPCLVCHTLHIRSCNSPLSTLSPRAPRQISETASKTQFERSEWPLSSREKVIQYGHHSKSANGHQSRPDECVDEPGCGKGGQRTMCKIRSDTLRFFLPCIRKIRGKTGKIIFDHYHGWFDPSKQQILKCADVCNTKSHSLHKNVSTSHIIDIILD